jgi:heavy metal sensor kinase
MINIRSIQFRLILWYSTLVVTVLVAFGAYIYRQVETGLYADLERTLHRRGTQIAVDILPQLPQHSPQEIARQIREVYSPEATGRFIRIRRTDASVLYLSGAPDGGLFDPARIGGGMPIPGERTVRLPNGGEMLVVAVPARIGAENFVVEMGGSTAEIDGVLARLLRTLLTGLSLVVVLVSAGGYILVRRSLRPVEHLRGIAQELTFGKARRRLPVPRSGDAIEHLAVTLNQMLDRLDHAYEQASRFSADASHELRTPLTIMRAELEAIVQRDLGQHEPIRARIDSVLEEAVRLSNITDALFTLSRLDAGEAKMREVSFDLCVMVRNTVEQMKLLIEEKPLALTLDTPEPAPVRGDPDRLKQALIDLLDNAIKYTPAGGALTLRVLAHGGEAVVEIIDTGIGIPAEALPHVFDRFYRAESTRAQHVPGAGLGLAIVRSICDAHGGAVRITSVEGAGTTCRITLPLSASSGEFNQP